MTTSTEQQTSQLDPTMVRTWLNVLYVNTPGLIHISSTGNWAGRAFTEHNQAADYVTRLDAGQPEGIYLRATTLRGQPERGGRGSAADSHALPGMWADLDIDGPGHKHQVCADDCTKTHVHITRPLPPTDDAARQIITDSGLPDPTLWVHSGGGLYPWWLLDQHVDITADNLADIEQLSIRWQAAIGRSAAALGWHYGTGVSDLARVLRIPGTVNRKEGLARPCRIVDAQPERYSLNQLRAGLTAAQQRHPEPAPPPVPVQRRLEVVRGPGEITPNDDFEQQVAWDDQLLLGGAGWTITKGAPGTYCEWRRPGKTTAGISATTGKDPARDRLYVFSDDAGLPVQQEMTKPYVYALLHHGGDTRAATRELARLGYGTPLPPRDPAAEQRAAIAELVPPARANGRNLAAVDGTAARVLDSAVPAATGPKPRAWTAELDVSNAAMAAEWLRDEIGRGRLAGMFYRAPEIVHTPREGEDGYIPTGTDKDDDGPAQVRVVSDSTLASRIQYTYGVYKMAKRDEDWEAVPALFPRAAAHVAVDVPDMLPNLRPLRGVTHSPILRADGTVLSEPGYDQTTGLLHLPEPGLTIPPISERPTVVQVANAVALLDEMVAGFAFLSEHDRVNYYGMLITPLLRDLVPPPYKLGAIGAPQPGSGKTLLANIARIIHGGVFRSEMPGDENELRKQISTILDHTTGPVVHFDNVTGVLRSSVMAGLLTSAKWDDRRLGANEMINAKNDRLWVITGNNLSLGGDLSRRALWCTIDPGVPDPHLRTDFAIKNLEEWVRARRGELICALLTIAAGWISDGAPTRGERGSDSYARWIETVDGIFAHAGVPGRFADAESARQETGSDDDEWRDFLAKIREVFSNRPWTGKEVIDSIDTGSLIDRRPIPIDALPTDLAEKAARSATGVAGIGRSLGRWLANREGRWAGNLTVRSLGKDRTGAGLWKIQMVGESR
ncbi:hypothetical protein GCM10027280_45590 [Micromonospora polyrhachis]|uniref:Uncharacterized protein n=1 Tax=Micromonospora polyrhachis TaxID=1282883 RepID=A0A7W7SQ62_9ACTN|nr:hypothetical protein [Micromonospora polyrhachis]MBB4958927.1 hypothetical protein [Micromonospora polyrhachis]